LKQWNVGNDKRTDFSRQSTHRKRDCDDAATDFIAMALAFDVENLINFVQNECVLRDLYADSSKENKELAWHRVANDLGFLTGKHRHPV